MSGAKSRAPALRSSFANVRGLLPRWAWILVFLGLAIAYPYVVPNLLGGGAGDDLSTHRSTPSATSSWPWV